MAIQDMFNKSGVIYKITSDINLEGETLTIPENCTLDFQGGSFSNGIIKGNNTSIKASSNKIFDNIEGTWNVDYFDPCWFGLYYSSSDNSEILNRILSLLPIYSVLKFNKSNICNCTSNVSIRKEGIKILDANIKGPNVATFDIYANNVTFDNCYFSNCSQVIRLYNCENIQVLNCYFKSCSYSIIQQLGYASNNVLIDGCICEDAVADFVEANCTTSAPSKNWTIVNNQFLGSISYPNTKTEERFVGITAVTNVVISNNIVEKVAGDAAVHLEDVGSTIIVSNNTFDKIRGTDCIYTMNSSYDVLVEGNIFKCTDDYGYTAWYEGGTSSRKIFSNNVLIGNLVPIYWSDSGNNIIKGNLFRGTSGINLEAIFDIEISNNTFVGMRTPIGTQRGGDWRGNPKFIITGNYFKDTSASTCIECPRNTNSGTGHTKLGIVINNIFDKGISGHANNSNLQDTGKVFIGNNVLLSGSISFSGAETTNNKVYS